MAPPYATRAREYLGDLGPLAVRRPLLEDLEVHPRVWLFALFGAEVELDEQLAAVGFERTLARRADGIAVHRYERPARSSGGLRLR